MELWKPALLQCMKLFSPEIKNLRQVRETSFVKSLLSEICPEWEGSFRWSDLLDFVQSEYANFDPKTNPSDSDIIVLSLLLLHGMVLKPCSKLQQRAASLEPNHQKYIMVFLESTMAFKEEIMFENIEQAICMIEPEKLAECASPAVNKSSSTPLRDFFNSPAATRARRVNRSEVARLREDLYEERSENERLSLKIEELQQANKDLNVALADKRREITFLSEDLEAAQRKIQESSRQILNAEEIVSKKEELLDSLRKTLRDLEEEMDLAQKSCRNKDNEISSLEKERDHARSQAARFEQELVALQAKVDEYWTDKKNLMERCSLLERRLDEAECPSPCGKWPLGKRDGDTLANEMAHIQLQEKIAEMKDLNDALESAHEEILKLRQSLQAALDNCAEQAQKREDWEKKHAGLGADFKETVMKFANEMQTAHDHKEKLRTTFESEKNELNCRINDLTKLVQDKDYTVRIQQKEFEMEKSQWEKQKEERSAMLAKMEEEVLMKNSKLSDAEKDIVLKDSLLANAREEIRVKSDKLAEAEEEIRVKNVELAQAGEIIRLERCKLAETEEEIRVKSNKLAEEIRLLTAELAETKEEVCLKSDKIAFAEEEIHVKDSKLSEAEEELRLKSVELTEAKEEILLQSDKLAEAEKVIQLMSGKLVEAEDVIQLKNSDLAKAAEEIRAKSIKLAETEEKIQLTHGKLEEAEEEIRRMSTELGRAEEEILVKSGKLVEGVEEIRLKSAELEAAAEKIRSMSDSLTAAGEEIRLISGKLKESEERIRLMSAKLEEAEEEIRVSSAKLEKSEGEICVKSVKLTEAEEEIRMKNAKLEEVEEEIRVKSAEFAGAAKEIHVKSDKLSAAQVEVAAMSAKLVELEKEISLKDVKLLQKEEALALKNSVISEKEVEIGEKGTTIDEKNSIIAEKNDIIEEKKGIIADKDRIISDMSTIIAEKDRVILEKDEDMSQKAAVLSEKERTIASLENYITSLQQELEEAKQEVEDSLESQSTLFNNLSTVQRLNDALDLKVTQFTKDNEELNVLLSAALPETNGRSVVELVKELCSEIGRLKEALSQNANEVVACKLKLNRSEETLLVRCRELEECRLLLKHSEDALSLSANELETCKLQLRRLEEELNLRCSELEDRELQLKRSKKLLSDSSAEVESLSLQLKKSAVEKLELEKSNEQVNAKIGEINLSVQTYEEQLQDLKNIVSSKDSIIEQLVREKEELKKTLDQVEKNMEDAATLRSSIESELEKQREEVQELQVENKSKEEKLESFLKSEKAIADLQSSLDAVIRQQKTEVHNHLSRLRSWLDRVTDACDSLTKSLPGSCTAVFEVNSTKRDIEQMLRSVDDKYVSCLTSTISCSDNILKLTVHCDDGGGDRAPANLEDKEQLLLDLSAVRTLMSELVGDVRDVISRCKFLVDRCDFFMDEQARQVLKVKTSLTRECPDGGLKTEEEKSADSTFLIADPNNEMNKSKNKKNAEFMLSLTRQLGTSHNPKLHKKLSKGDVEKKYHELQLVHKDLQHSYTNLEAKLKEVQENFALKNDDHIHKHYAAKLETLKIKMDQICTAEINKIQRERDNSERDMIAKYEKTVTEYRSHVEGQASHVWELNEKLIQKDHEIKALQVKLSKLQNKLFDGCKPPPPSANTAAESLQNIRHSLSVDWLDRMGQDDVPLISRSRPDRQSLCERKRSEPPAKPKRAVLTTSMGRIEEGASNPSRPSATGNAVMAPASMGVAFPEEDEDGELFNNTYLADMKAGRSRLNEFQQRNSMCPPHLKSSYPAETQFHDPKLLNEDEIKVTQDGRRLTKDRSQGKEDTKQVTPRAVLQEPNRQSSGSLMNILRTGKTTPSRLRALFASSKVGAVQGAAAAPANHKGDENEVPLTPTSKRMSIFRKRFGPREPPPNSSFSTYR